MKNSKARGKFLRAFMKPSVVCLRTKFDFPAKAVFSWHFKPDIFYRMIPPWERVQILSRTLLPGHIGSEVFFRSKLGPFSIFWKLKQITYVEDESFATILLKGPFRYWKYTHRVFPTGKHTCEWEEEMYFIFSFPPFRNWIEKRVRRMLVWKQERIKNDLLFASRYKISPLRILLSGSSGFIGSEALYFLKSLGHEVIALSRSKRKKKTKPYLLGSKKGKSLQRRF